MFYSMTRLHYPEEGLDELLELAGRASGRLREVPGLRRADFVSTGDGEGMLMAIFDDEEAHEAAADMVGTFLAEIDEFLTSPPHGHEGKVVARFIG